MNSYDTPEVFDLGSLADLTRGGVIPGPDVASLGDGTEPPSI